MNLLESISPMTAGIFVFAGGLYLFIKACQKSVVRRIVPEADVERQMERYLKRRSVCLTLAICCYLLAFACFMLPAIPRGVVFLFLAVAAGAHLTAGTAKRIVQKLRNAPGQ